MAGGADVAGVSSASYLSSGSETQNTYHMQAQASSNGESKTAIMQGRAAYRSAKRSSSRSSGSVMVPRVATERRLKSRKTPDCSRLLDTLRKVSLAQVVIRDILKLQGSALVRVRGGVRSRESRRGWMVFSSSRVAWLTKQSPQRLKRHQRQRQKLCEDDSQTA